MVRPSLLPSGCTSGRGSSSSVALASAWGLLAALLPSAAPAAQPVDCTARASDACFLAMSPGQGKAMLHYYASLPEVAPTAAVATTAPPPAARPVRALIVMHGHPRDANKSFDAGLKAVSGAGLAADTLVVAPLFQVDAAQAGKCSTAGVPAASEGDLLWTCASWMAGAPASNDAAITSFRAMDALVAHLVDRWPSLRNITIAGFSAGAQMVQHYIGFAAAARVGDAAIRYVVSDPGTWLYFDAFRQSPPRFCAAVDR